MMQAVWNVDPLCSQKLLSRPGFNDVTGTIIPLNVSEAVSGPQTLTLSLLFVGANLLTAGPAQQ